MGVDRKLDVSTEPCQSVPGSRVLVTGASGFLGRATLGKLAVGGHEVIATHRGYIPPDTPRGVEWVQVDLTDPQAVAALCETHRPSHLLALAWHMGPGAQQAAENFRWVQHSIDLLFAFAAAGGQRVVFSGSCMEYDWSLETPFAEDSARLEPDIPYGAAKAALYTLFDRFCALHGLSGAWGRPFFLYGPGENPNRLAADVILSLLQGREALCTHGQQKRDFLHVDDVADAMVNLLWSDHEGALNIGSGTAIPLARLIDEIGHQIGRPELIRLGARSVRPGDPGLVEADITRLRARLDWTPKYTLKTGIAQTIEWWRGTLEEAEAL